MVAAVILLWLFGKQPVACGRKSADDPCLPNVTACGWSCTFIDDPGRWQPHQHTSLASSLCNLQHH